MSMDQTKKDTIRQTIESMLTHINVPYTVNPPDQRLYDLSCKMAIENGYPIGTDSSEPSLLRSMWTGVALGSNTYGHLDEATCVFMTLYTAFLVYVDDVYEADNSGVSTFVGRFVRGEKQADAVLDALARFLRTIPDKYEPLTANVTMLCTLHYFNATTLEHQTQGMKVSNHAKEFPHYVPRRSGGSDTYAVSAFPNIPANRYIQCLPEMCAFIGYLNDVLSFYKEEVVGENFNCISWLAQTQGQTKMEAFAGLAEEVATVDSQIFKILEGELEDLYEDWQQFKAGYVAFHASCQRYRLDEIMA